ncbi:MAG: lipoyl(octanoyl) transferase LipB [Solirubrobacteraceae bacterium]
MTPASEQDAISTCWLGTVPYRDGLEIQAELEARRQAEEIPDALLLLEHPAVYTRGRRAGDAELALGEAFYTSKGIEIVPVNRGGRVTYHGPGQLVGYPIMRIVDVLEHLRTIEAALVQALADEGIPARSRCQEGPDWTGVWVGDRKIASLGVHVAHGVTTHGFAVNVVNDLTPFDWIVPCGLPGVSMTSVHRELGRGPCEGFDGFRDRVARRLCEAYGRARRTASPTELCLGTALAA